MDSIEATKWQYLILFIAFCLLIILVIAIGLFVGILIKILPGCYGYIVCFIETLPGGMIAALAIVFVPLCYFLRKA